MNNEINEETEKKAGLGGCLVLIIGLAAISYGVYILMTL